MAALSIIEIELKENKIIKVNVGDLPKSDSGHRLIENPFDD